MYAPAETDPAIMRRAFQLLARPLTVQSLTLGHEDEVLAFLAQRPIHTVIMAGFIRDNGVVSLLNRGNFYGCRNAKGRLEGVALIGHVTMVEPASDEALELFAQLARKYERAHVIVGEQEKVERFWEFYGPTGQSMRRLCRELLFEQSWSGEVLETVDLRLATLDDIEQLLPVHAQMAFEESGINPLERDPIGFRERTTRRIEQGRVWVSLNQEKLVFKADVISDTPEQIYIEGVYLNPQERGKGYGVRFVSQLSRSLLAKTKSVSLLVNEKDQVAQACYRKAGYKECGYYDTVYLQQ
ncbi:MAG: GNAT family N-acetyltransferase [Acidobacteriota bacterium]|nr:GNAT family N-acetyltransferase [Acidobacteriota bacterium]